MVKFFAVMAVVLGSLVAVDTASAFGHGHRGCSTCGGCPGGVCGAPVAVPVKAAGIAPVAPVVAGTVAPAPAPVYYTSNARRGLFGRR